MSPPMIEVEFEDDEGQPLSASAFWDPDLGWQDLILVDVWGAEVEAPELLQRARRELDRSVASASDDTTDPGFGWATGGW